MKTNTLELQEGIYVRIFETHNSKNEFLITIETDIFI